MFDDVYNEIEQNICLTEEIVNADTAKTISDVFNRSLSNISNVNKVYDPYEDKNITYTKMAKYNRNNYYSIYFTNSNKSTIDKSIKIFDDYSSEQYSNALMIFKNDRRHKVKLMSLLAAGYVDMIVEDAEKRRDPIQIFRNNPPNTLNPESLAIFKMYGDIGYDQFKKKYKALDTGELIIDDKGQITSNDLIINRILDEKIPNVFVESIGDKYYLLKPYDITADIRKALKSAISSPNPQGVTIHEIIDGKFSVKVVTPEKGAFINKIRDPSSNKTFDFKSQNEAALKKFHIDIIKIFQTRQPVTEFANIYNSTIMYLSQEDFDRVVKTPSFGDTVKNIGMYGLNKLNTAKGYVI